MSFCPDQKLEKAEFDAIAAVVFERLWELTPWSKHVFDAQFRTGMVEQWRGRNAATTGQKSQFIENILSVMVARQAIASWTKIGSAGRSDYKIGLTSGRTAVLEAKGSMDGNSATILERPPYADELIVWTITTNPMSDVVANVWSGIHTRISPEYIVAGKRVDVIIAWDQMGSSIKLCPDLADVPTVAVGDMVLPPPCIYLLPHELPVIGLRNPVRARELCETEFARSVCACFGVPASLVGNVEFELGVVRNQLARRTRISFGKRHYRASSMTTLKRDLTAYEAAAAAEKLAALDA